MPRKGYIPKHLISLVRGSKMDANALKKALIAACETMSPASLEKKYGFKHGTAVRLVRKCKELNLSIDGLSKMTPDEVSILYYARKAKAFEKVGDKQVPVIRPDVKLLEDKYLESHVDATYGSKKKLALTKHTIIELFYFEDTDNKELVAKGEAAFLSESRILKLWKQYTNQIKTPTYKREHELAGEAQYDFTGVKLPYVQDGVTKYATFIVGVLSASGYIFLKAIRDQSTESSCEAIAESFRYFGGGPSAIRIDNFKAAVRSPSKYNGELTEEMQRLATFFDVDVIACRPYKPKDKGMAEAVVRFCTKYAISIANHYVKDGLTFNSLDEINDFIKPYVEKMNERKLRRLKQARKEVFLTQEKHLLRIPESFDYSVSSTFKAKIPSTSRIEYKGHYYALPSKWAGQDVFVTLSTNNIKFFQNSLLITTYERKDNIPGVSSYDNVIPHNLLCFDIFNINGQDGLLREWASQIGPNILNWVTQSLKSKINYPDKVRYIVKVLSACSGFKNQYKAFDDLVKDLVATSTSKVKSSTIIKKWKKLEKEPGTIFDTTYNYDKYFELGSNVINGKSSVMVWSSAQQSLNTTLNDAFKEYLNGSDVYAARYDNVIVSLSKC